MNYKKIYIIYDTLDDSFVSINHKEAWTAAGRAKAAFTTAYRYAYNSQERYIVLPITTDEVR
jgi:hypothetical protein